MSDKKRLQQTNSFRAWFKKMFQKPAEVSRCKRCHKVLTDPESIKLGLGPDCFRKERERWEMVPNQDPRVPESETLSAATVTLYPGKEAQPCEVKP